ncbi:MAG: toll/interleukin-1 receptor domain-containing protein [Anaerolineales bacterium]
MRVFLCFAPRDTSFAQELIGVLRENGYDVFPGMLGQGKWQNHIDGAAVLLYLLSDTTANCQTCEAQWRHALAHGKRILTLKLSAVPIPEELRAAQVVDYLDFVAIGQQIQEGIPVLRRARYATEVTLRMLLVELAEMQRQEEAARARLLAQADALSSESTAPLRPDALMPDGDSNSDFDAMREKLIARLKGWLGRT